MPNRERIQRLSSVLSLVILLAACRPYHSTPSDALREFPGYLENADPTTLNAIHVLQQEDIAGGIVMLYAVPTSTSDTYLLARTFLTQEISGGWRAQASGNTFYTNTDAFIAAYTVGGNITPLTSAYGIGRMGAGVRIEWSDGQTTTASIQNGIFLQSRPETLQVKRIDLLDETGNVLASEEFK